MALTVAVTERSQSGNKIVNRGTIAFDASYPTGGESLTANQLGLRVVESINFEVEVGHVLEYDYSNATVKVFFADYDAGADGALIEFTSTGDLSSTITAARFTALGV